MLIEIAAAYLLIKRKEKEETKENYRKRIYKFILMTSSINKILIAFYSVVISKLQDKYFITLAEII